MGLAPTLELTTGDLARIERQVRALAENRPAVYRMLDARGRVLYVGKAKRLRNRLLAYFRAQMPYDKAARVLHASSDLNWDYMPSEFAALLGELRQIRRYRPGFNVRMKRVRKAAFVKVSSGKAPKVYVGTSAGPAEARHYGPFDAVKRVNDAVRVLQDILGLRDCALDMPMVYSGQADLFGPMRRAACIRYELGTCSGPCAGFVSAADYRRRVDTATQFLEARAAAPLDRVVREMAAASRVRDFELAAWWRTRFDALEWLLAASIRANAAIDSLSFVYLDPGTFGDDRAYVIRRATVRASAPAPRTPIEVEAFRALVAEHSGAAPEHGPIPVEAIDETLLLLRWFRTHPSALARTVPLREWLERPGPFTS
jgi:excinuclease ABC subunit C